MGFLEVPLVFYLLLCLSCSQKEEDSERELPERTVLVYMAADNNLYGSVRADIEEKEMLPAETPPMATSWCTSTRRAWSEGTCPQLFSIRQGEATPAKQYGIEKRSAQLKKVAALPPEDSAKVERL